MTAPGDPVVTVCGLPDDAPPELLAALAAIGRAAAEAFGEPGEPVEVVISDGPCGCDP